MVDLRYLKILLAPEARDDELTQSSSDDQAGCPISKCGIAAHSADFGRYGPMQAV